MSSFDPRVDADWTWSQSRVCEYVPWVAVVECLPNSKLTLSIELDSSDSRWPARTTKDDRESNTSVEYIYMNNEVP